MQCGTRFTFLSHCQFVLIELVSCVCVSFSVSVGVIAFMIRFILTSHRTYILRPSATIASFNWIKRYSCLSAMCYMCLHALHSSICLYRSHRLKTWRKADVCKWKIKKRRKKKQHERKKNKTTRKQKQKPNKIKNNQSQHFALKTLDKQINENDEETRKRKKEKKIIQTFDASENRINIPTESRLFTQK